MAASYVITSWALQFCTCNGFIIRSGCFKCYWASIVRIATSIHFSKWPPVTDLKIAVGYGYNCFWVPKYCFWYIKCGWIIVLAFTYFYLYITMVFSKWPSIIDSMVSINYHSSGAQMVYLVSRLFYISFDITNYSVSYIGTQWRLSKWLTKYITEFSIICAIIAMWFLE